MNAEEITEALRAQGYVVEKFRETYLSIKLADHASNMKLAMEYMNANFSEKLEHLLAFIDENGWSHEKGYFVPTEWGFIITRLDS